MKKIVALVLAVAMVALALCACGGGAAAPAADAAASSDKKVVGLLMPTKEQTIWSVQGDTLTEAYKAAGYDVLIEFAEDDSAKQAMQIENMISKGANALVIVAVDCAALTDACEKAKEAGCVVIAEDRLIENTDAVDFYVTFDLDKMGELQGQYIADALGLADGKGPFNLEIFSGSQDDTNATHFYDGAMKVLQPYLDNGKLVVQSGQVSYAETAIQGWDSAKAQSRCDNLLSGFYSDKTLDACLVAADCLDIGVISSLESMGYGTAEKPFPVTTGQDAELAAVKNIPFVCVDSHVKKDGYLPLVEVDYYKASYDATQYLARMGHKDIGYIGSSTPHELHESTFNGYIDAMRDEGLACNPAWIGGIEFSATAAGEFFDSLVEGRFSVPTAFFCTGDAFSVNLLNAAKRHGYRIPEDLSIVSVDDLLVSRYVSPALSTMSFDKEALGAKAVDVLHAIINDEPHQTITMISPEILERDSVKRLN